jgi:hypothetical protein
MTDSPIIAFYRGAGPDHRGRFLHEIREFGVEELEGTHDFIQWLFPLPERSGANPYAPLLSASDIESFGADPGLRMELLRSFVVMLRFYGLELAGTDAAPRIDRAGNYAQRSAEWLDRPHNFLRISRILRCLGLLGCASFARAFLRCLEGIYRDNPDAIGATTVGFWRKA